MVIGLFPSPDHAAVCLSNLAEADFGPDTLSVIMRTPGAAQNFAHATGRLSAIPVAELPPALVTLGIAPASAAAYRDAVLQGEIFLAVDAAGVDDIAKQMLQDHGARDVQMIGGKEKT
jgi:hypothetical protein